jgi:chromosome segregation protein
MRLKRVKIFGFKTFADKTELDLDGDIIAIVGPNGCGKSNIVDAILWGLGEGNVRQLRAQSSQDVIFNGSSQRKALGYAEVTLHFDNEDGVLPIQTSEVTVSRRLNRAGESEYMINRRPCRLRDVLDLMADSGLGRSGYAIVGQKDIDQALAASAEDRRAWVDEAAGVQRYRTRKVDSLKRLAAAQGHLDRVADILREIETQREPLREEAEVALKYKSALSALRQVESDLLIKEVAAAVRDVTAQEESIAKATALIREESNRADSLDAQIKQAGDQIGALEQEMETVRGLQQGSLTALERAEATIRLCEQKLESLKDLEENLGEEAESSKRRIAEAQADLDVVVKEQAAEAEALDRLREEVSGAGEEAGKLRATLVELEKRLGEARELHAERLKVEAEEAHRKQRRREIRREIAGIQETLPDLEGAAAEAKGGWEEKQAESQALAKAISDAETAIHQAAAEDEREGQAVRRLLAERATLDGRRRGIEATIDTHEGLNQGARAVLEAVDHGLLKGSYSPVGEAIDVDKEYAVAIETALGGAANDLIVDHEDDAKRAIELLKRERLGRATFQPITLMRTVTVSSDLAAVLRKPGVLGRASELVRCEAKFRPVIESLLGRVVVVDNIDTALAHARTVGWNRLVTLDGEVVHGGGAVTGGRAAKQGYGLVQRKAELSEVAKEVDRLSKLVAEAEKRSQERKERREALVAEMEERRRQRKEHAAEVEEARQWLQSLNDELTTTRRSLQKLEHELDLLKAVEQSELPAIDIPALEGERDTLLKSLAGRTADAEQAEERLREAELRLSQAQARVYHAERRVAAAEEAAKARDRKLESVGPEREKTLQEQAKAEKDREEAKEAKHDADIRLEITQAHRKRRLEESFALSEEAKGARQNVQACTDTAHQAELNRARADSKRAASLQRLMEEYGISEEEALDRDPEVEVPPDAPGLVSRLRRELKSMGDVNLGAIEAFERLTERHDELTGQQKDILEGIEQVEASIRELDKLTRERFTTTFAAVQEAFTDMFQRLFGGGQGSIALSDPDNILESGIDIDVTLPGKKRQRLELLSGGERALCAATFLFALLKVRPSPLVVLDEIDAPLDGRNVERFVELLKEFSGMLQFIVITHNPTTIVAAPVWLGVTMQEPGVSTLVPARLPAAEVVEDVLAPRPVGQPGGWVVEPLSD